MPYENPYLVEFAPIFLAVLKERDIKPNRVAVVVFDEESWEMHPFEWTSVVEVLHQLREYLNALTVYTDRPELFVELVETAYEENGLVILLLPKKEQHKVGGQMFHCRKGSDTRKEMQCETSIILDFEWRGICYNIGKYPNCYYIPIHKKPWKMADNLDIEIPFGYNTVIVKGKYTNDKKFIRDRFDEGFYRDE